MENSKVPAAVMELTNDEKISYFSSKLISHPKLEDAFQQSKLAIKNYKTPLILLYGPSGVGKSTLLSKLYNDLVKEIMMELYVDHSKIPVVFFESKAAESIQFSWKDYFKAGLLELNEPCIDKKISPREIVSQKLSRETLSALRWSFESALIHRKPLACIVDEAQHIAKIPRGSKLLDQMDVIKSIANVTKVPHVLAGTYELIKFRNKSAQLSNRSLDIHISRYRAESHQDLQHFQTCILSLQDHFPVQEIDLLTHWEFLYERSIGCIGVLKLWLERALNMCLTENSAHFSPRFLEKTALSIKQCNTMVREAREGELELHETEEERNYLLSALGLNKINQSSITKTEKKKSNKVAQRSPTRDRCSID